MQKTTENFDNRETGPREGAPPATMALRAVMWLDFFFSLTLNHVLLTSLLTE